MTAEKAIEILSDVGDINRCCEEDAEALDMAIKALEQQPCEDAISRQAAIDVVRKWFDKIQLNGDICFDGIISLPSVTPTRPTGKWKRIHPQGIYECSECGINLMTGDIECYEYCHGCGARMAESEGKDAGGRRMMISVEKMEEITEILVNGIFRDGEIMYCEMPLVEYNGKRYDLRDIVATLHNYLYEAVEGKRYDYMFHWANKVLADCDDDVFEEDNEEDKEAKKDDGE